MCYVQVQLLCGTSDRLIGFHNLHSVQCLKQQDFVSWHTGREPWCGSNPGVQLSSLKAAYTLTGMLWPAEPLENPQRLFPYPQAMVKTPPWASVPKTTNPLKIGWLSLKRVLNLTNACLTPLRVMISPGRWLRVWYRAPTSDACDEPTTLMIPSTRAIPSQLGLRQETSPELWWHKSHAKGAWWIRRCLRRDLEMRTMRGN